jgi:hypothetical protein
MAAIRPERGIELVALFPDAEAATRAADDMTRAGFDPTVERDRALSARAEMEEELDHTWWSGGLGAFATDEMSKPAATLGMLLGGAGALLGAVLTAVLASGPGAWWVRALVGAIIGAIFLGTVGLVVGGGMGARHPTDDVPAPGGVVVRVEDRSPVTADALARLRPVRLDRFRDGQYVETIVGDTPSTPHRLGRGLADPGSR